MTPTEILPELTADDLLEVEGWLNRLPPAALMTARMSVMLFQVSNFLGKLADLRRKG